MRDRESVHLEAFYNKVYLVYLPVCKSAVCVCRTNGQRRYRLNITQKYVFFLFWPGPRHCQKNAFFNWAKKRIYATRHPGDHRKPSEKLQCQGSWGVGWGQGELVCEGYWLKSMNEWISCTSMASSWKFCFFNFRKNKIKQNTRIFCYRVHSLQYITQSRPQRHEGENPSPVESQFYDF